MMMNIIIAAMKSRLEKRSYKKYPKLDTATNIDVFKTNEDVIIFAAFIRCLYNSYDSWKELL